MLLVTLKRFQMPSYLVSTGLKVIFAAGLIFLVVQGVGISSVYSQISKVSAPSIALAFGLLTGLSLIHSERWRLILRQLGVQLSLSYGLKLTLISYFFNQTLPSTVGGDAFRFWGIYRGGVTAHNAFASVIVDRVIGLFGLMLMILACSPWLLDLLPSISILWTVGVFIAVACIGFAILVCLSSFRVRLRRLLGSQCIVSVASCTRAVLLDARVAIRVLIFTLISYVVVSLAVYVLARGMLIDLNIEDSLMLVPVVILVTLIPVSVAGWGLREGSMVLVFGLTGMPAVEALSISILFGLVGLASGMPGGLLWLFDRSHNSKLCPYECGLLGKNKE